MAGFLARGFQAQCANGSPSPSRRIKGFTKGRTIRRHRGVQPRQIVKPLQWLFQFSNRRCPPAPCRLSTTTLANRMEDPDHSTVAGSAVMRAPCMGPPLHIPFYSRNARAVREPFVSSIITVAERQSQLRETMDTVANRQVRRLLASDAAPVAGCGDHPHLRAPYKLARFLIYGPHREVLKASTH